MSRGIAKAISPSTKPKSRVDHIIKLLETYKRPMDSFEITDELYGRDVSDDYWFRVLDWLDQGVESKKLLCTINKRGWKVYSVK